MSKISIDGHIIGTYADNVDYKKNNAATVEDALDALFQGEGGDGNNDVITLLEDSFIHQGGYASSQWEDMHYSQMRSNNHTIDNWQTNDVYFDPTQTFSSGWNNETSMCFKVNKGDVVHYNGLGNTYERPLVITDNNYKVLYAGSFNVDDSTFASGVINIQEDGWVFAYAFLKGGTKNSYVYAQWSERKSVKKRPIYCCFGDSISTDSSFADQRPVAYPRILAGLMGAELSRHSMGGANINMMYGGNSLGYERSRSDADIVTILYGANDCFQISENYPVGAASDVMELDVDTDYSSFRQTWIGKYRYLLEMLLIRSPKAKIVCIGSIGMNHENDSTVLADMRTQLSALVSAMNSARTDDRLFYVNGKTTLLDYNAYYYLTSDATHPNMIGEYVMAHNLYDKCIKQLIEP